jgi:DNA-binding SARP family transcriptional activator
VVDPTFPRVQALGPLRVFDAHGTEHVPRGRAERTLLLLLVLNGRCVHEEHAMDVLWPELPLVEARDRLRKLLYRLPRQWGRLVFREGETLVLRASTDLGDFETAIATLLICAGLEIAPEARYAEWADPARRRLTAASNQLAVLL